jgi:hypothetical protein
MRRNAVEWGLLFFMAVLVSGCASDFTKVAPRPPEKFQKLGRASGTACGSMIIGDWVLHFIPIALNSRVERAYAEALSSVPGATAMVDVTYQERWYYWAIGDTRCVTITGEAIR